MTATAGSGEAVVSVAADRSGLALPTAPSAAVRPVVSTRAAVDALVRLGLVGAQEQVHLEQRSRSHAVLVVRAQRGSFVVKIAADAGGRRDLRREVATLRLAGTERALRRTVPTLRAADHARRLMITDEVGGTPAASALRDPRHRVTVRLAAAIGRWHRRTAGRPFLAAPPPWPLAFGRDPVHALEHHAGAGADVLHSVAADPRLRTVLRQLGAAWRATAIVHGDLKADNAILAAGGRMVITDWELAALGDPAWDVGSLVAEALATQLTIGTAEQPRAVLAAWWAAARPRSWAGPDLAGRIAASTIARLCAMAVEAADAGGPRTRAASLLGKAHDLAARPHDVSWLS